MNWAFEDRTERKYGKMINSFRIRCSFNSINKRPSTVYVTLIPQEVYWDEIWTSLNNDADLKFIVRENSFPPWAQFWLKWIWNFQLASRCLSHRCCAMEPSANEIWKLFECRSRMRAKLIEKIPEWAFSAETNAINKLSIAKLSLCKP